MIGALLFATAVAVSTPGTDRNHAEWHLEKRRRSCFIEAASDRDTYLKLEHDPFHAVHYLTVSATAWQGVVDEQAYRIGIEFDGQPRLELAATGVKDGDNPRTLVIFALPGGGPFGTVGPFVARLRKARILQLDLDGERPLSINVKGSTSA